MKKLTWACMKYLHLKHPARIYLFKVNKETSEQCEICLKLTIKTAKRNHWSRSGVFIVNHEQISHIVLVFLVDFEQVNAS